MSEGDAMMRKDFKDRVGQVSGRLTVVAYSHHNNGLGFWKCSCSCGNTVTVRAKSLGKNGTQSCGCLQVDGQLLMPCLLLFEPNTGIRM